MRSHLAKPRQALHGTRRSRGYGQTVPRPSTVERWLEEQPLNGIFRARGRVLEIGCGCTTARFFCERGYETYGLDPSEEAVRAAERQAPRATFLIGRLEDAEFPDEFFDLIVAFDCQTPSSRDGHAGILKRLLRPGGVVLSKQTSGELVVSLRN